MDYFHARSGGDSITFALAIVFSGLVLIALTFGIDVSILLVLGFAGTILALFLLSFSRIFNRLFRRGYGEP